MIAPPAAASDQLIETLRGTIIAMVQHAGADLTARQLGVFLICYPDSEPQTVRGLAQQLNISKPAITRAWTGSQTTAFCAAKSIPTTAVAFSRHAPRPGTPCFGN